jgi:transcriptional regulator with GAF, ATPase, and Fis domain
MSRDGSGFRSTHPKAPASGFVGPEQVISVVHPPELAGQRFLLRAGLTLGRSTESDVVTIAHSTVSRRHATIRPGLGGVPCISDLGSRNGTVVNGNRPGPLEAQSVLRLGDVLLVVDESSTANFYDDPVFPGASPRIATARANFSRAAADPAPVLVFGETGTGKERVAKEVHVRSGRRGAYVTLNCAELSPPLIESELFGHERGAFTGAGAAKTGLFVAAHAGTLFLDEIGELPLELQAKLLRVLQEGELRPVGSTKTVTVDVRIVAATNRDLPQLVQADAFRRDLYARLAFWELRLPPLRERRQDILPFIELLLRTWNEQRGSRAELQFLPDAAERILLHDWLDNLRGLDRMVHRLASLGLERPVSVRTLAEAMPEFELVERQRDHELPPAAERPSAAGSGSTLPPRDRPDREEFLAVYEASGRSVRATSKHFGKDRRQIYRWLESFGLARGPQD